MIKVQNLAPYPIDTPSGTIESAQIGEVESLDAVAGLLDAGLLVEVDETDTQSKTTKRDAKAETK